MSAGRIIIAGLVGGIAMFAWGAIAHMALPIGEMGFKSLPPEAEAKLVPHMKSELKERGFYFFPGGDMHTATEEQTKAWEEKLRQGPQGILVYQPAGSEAMGPKMLGTEFASNALASLILAVVLSRVRGGWCVRLMIGAALGLFGWTSLCVSYWNWYNFPTDFTIGQGIEQVVGGLFAAAGVALVLGKEKTIAH